MKKILIIILIILSNKIIGQNSDTLKIIKIADIAPEYSGGLENLYQTINDNLVYPETAKNDKVEGTVYVSFVIDKFGVMRDVKVVRGIRDDLDQEAILIIEQLKGWIPGKKKEKNVDVQMVLPVKFTLPDKSVKDTKKEQRQKKKQKLPQTE